MPSDPSTGRSNNLMLILLIVGGGFALLVLACCGFFGYFAYQGAQLAQNVMKMEPAEVEAAATEITEIDIPPQFAPQMAMKIPPTQIHSDKMSTHWMTTVMFQADGVGQESLQLLGFTEVDFNFPGNEKFTPTEEQMRQELEGNMDNFSYEYVEAVDGPAEVVGDAGDLDEPADAEDPMDGEADAGEPAGGEAESSDEEQEEETVERTIRGEAASFLIRKENVGSGPEGPFRWVVEGEFQGKQGPAALQLRIATDRMSKDEIIDLIDSIR